MKLYTLILLSLVSGLIAIRFSHRTITYVRPPEPTPKVSISVRRITGYTLSEGETDSTPCETALGKKVDICKLAQKIQICASNDYKMLTKLEVGDKLECVVADRVPKHANTVDLVMEDRQTALEFGVAYLPVSAVGMYSLQEIHDIINEDRGN